MKALRHHGERPAAVPLTADEVLEFHAGRLVLLMAICGKAQSITGLTKLAKLDFFARYPDFFAAATGAASDETATVEAAMVRHHYGPWDKRYYHVLAFLEARGLITVRRIRNSVRFSLTKEGRQAAEQLAESYSFGALTAHMTRVAAAFAEMTGTELKTLIYRTFGADVTDRPLGHIIGDAAT